MLLNALAVTPTTKVLIAWEANYVEFLRRHPGVYDTPADNRQAGP